uniref:C2H2-type domain-containing protein n=1 Tax=Clastoptera arizonana TaxID=38151 RepID=A0A1B6EAV2_9HEMI
MVKCGRCGEEMVKSVYNQSHLSKHNYLCWIEGEKPIDLNDEDAVRKFLYNVSQKLKKKIVFKCESCGESKRSAVGYMSHVKFCGKTDEEREALLIKCKICGCQVKPVSITTHMEMHNRKRKVPKSEKNHLSIEKRAAALKAVKGIGKVSNYSDNEKEGNTKKIRMEVGIEVRQMYTRSYNKVYVSQIEVWKKSISENGNGKCLYPGCNFIGQTVEVLENHGMQCPRKPQKVYSCRKCKFQSSEEQLVIEHIEEIHNNGEDSYSSESDVDDEAGFQDIKFIQSNSRLRFYNFFYPALKWTYEKRLKNSDTCNESLCYKISNWTPMDSDKIKCYLPTTKKSVKIMVNEQNWEQLELFQSLELNGTQAIFVGGPVWASAWAPVPLTETHQYLAVACHPNMDTEHEMGRIYDYKSMIQIWDYGELCNIGDNNGVAPFLLLGIAHNHGAVWCLDWCVSGFISTQLGLLAAAFSDGTVEIYSIPRHRPSDGYTMYKVKPVCVLKLGSEILSQCMRVEWHKIFSSRVIAAGFSNGMVAVWDLNTSSSLLRSDDTLYPYCIFQAHNSAVTGISFGPGEEVRYMCTSSHDRTIKFWDLQNTDYPISVNQKGSATDTAWMANWLCSVSTHDSIYGYGLTYVNATNGRDFVYHSNSLLQQNSVNWSVGICDWLNSIGMSDEAGNVNIMFLFHLGCVDDKKARKHSFNLIKTSIHDFKEDNSLVTGHVQQNKSNNARTKKNKQGITLFEKSLDSDLTKYKEMASRFGLSLSVDKKLESTHNDGSKENLINHFPLSSINKVSWNPNYSSFLWIAAGFQCGIILTPRIGYIKDEVLKTLYKEKQTR